MPKCWPPHVPIPLHFGRVPWCTPASCSDSKYQPVGRRDSLGPKMSLRIGIFRGFGPPQAEVGFGLLFHPSHTHPLLARNQHNQTKWLRSTCWLYVRRRSRLNFSASSRTNQRGNDRTSKDECVKQEFLNALVLGDPECP